MITHGPVILDISVGLHTLAGLMPWPEQLKFPLFTRESYSPYSEPCLDLESIWRVWSKGFVRNLKLKK